MKKILITGKNSYIGMSFKRWVSQWDEDYLVDTIDLRDELWAECSFAGYDAVLHTAGIAHIKETRRNKELYYKINRDLTIEVANKAKVDGVEQFVFLSSMSVYGVENGVITKDTVPRPKSYYGRSKLQAEDGIKNLNDNRFKVAIIRPPMVYGKGCKGNYQRLSKLVKKSLVFPDVDNKRSMIYIDNICEFIRLVIENDEEGVFYPQNEEYVNSTELAREIAEMNGRKLKLTKGFNLFIKLVGFFIGSVNKVFGSLYYDMVISEYKEDYCKYDFRESIRLTEYT